MRFLRGVKTAIRAGEFKRSEMKGVSLSTRIAQRKNAINARTSRATGRFIGVAPPLRAANIGGYF